MHDTIIIAAPPGAVSFCARPEVDEVILRLTVGLLDVDNVTVLSVELPVRLVQRLALCLLVADADDLGKEAVPYFRIGREDSPPVDAARVGFDVVVHSAGFIAQHTVDRGNDAGEVHRPVHKVGAFLLPWLLAAVDESKNLFHGRVIVGQLVKIHIEDLEHVKGPVFLAGIGVVHGLENVEDNPIIIADSKLLPVYIHAFWKSIAHGVLLWLLLLILLVFRCVLADARVSKLLLSGESGINLIHDRHHQVAPDREPVGNGIDIHAAEDRLAHRGLEHAVNNAAHFSVPLFGKLEDFLLVHHLLDLGLVALLLLVQILKSGVQPLNEVAVSGVERHLALAIQRICNKAGVKIQFLHKLTLHGSRCEFHSSITNRCCTNSSSAAICNINWHPNCATAFTTEPGRQNRA
nr:MAG TPA: hypothetical protein [Caudoviricetes sp.]